MIRDQTDNSLVARGNETPASEYQMQVARQVVLLFYDHLMSRITYINVLITV